MACILEIYRDIQNLTCESSTIINGERKVRQFAEMPPCGKTVKF